ncbi:MAG TPA: DUF5916 domain-containing protein [Longimicrobiaceae bacterium]|nr:DUF5916 domain-containing protein [Longimicrobiaceae bacterium]
MRATAALAIAALLACPAALIAQHEHGQDPAPAPPASNAGGALPTPTLRASAAAGAVRIDGRLDEAAWAAAEPATGFVQQRPANGAPATERTEVRVLYAPDAILVGARMHDSRPDSIAAQLARRDATGIYSDWFHVLVDGTRDRRTGYRFSVNPRGVQRDVYHFNDTSEDGGWNAVWEVATAVDSGGWTAEIRIPLSQLRYQRPAGEAEAAWGINFVRDLARRDERSLWSPIPANHAGFVSRAGELRGLSGLRPARRLEVQPYSSGRLAREPGDRADPFYAANAVEGSLGADLKYGLTPSLTLTATLNPDFGQVELDPAVVNLTAFETFLPEQRPFFVEGADIFRFGQIRSYTTYGFTEFFYSRRVGRTPQRFVSARPDEWVDAPDQSTILGAAKLSGRVGRGWSVGVLDAVTAEERARFAGAGRDSTSPVEPLTNYFVGRVRRDLRGGGTVLGGLLSATHRDLGGAEFDGLLRSRALVYGADGEHAWGGREWVLSGFYARSRIEGSAGAIARAQGSSARYFQRPDADYLEVDPARTALEGHSAALSLQNNGPVHGSVTYQESSPGWEPNDLGFQGRTDYRSLALHLGRFHEAQGALFRRYYTHLYGYRAWNFGGEPVANEVGLLAGGTFHNLWNVDLSVAHYPARMDDRLTRGGPLAAVGGLWQAGLFVGTDPRRRLVAAAHGIATRGEGRAIHSLSTSLELRPSSTVQLRLEPSVSHSRVPDQYVTAVGDPLAEATFGRRYVFAELDQTTAALGMRVNWTFTPTLSLQLYARPFTSAVDYGGYREFLRPRAAEFARYGVDRGTIARRPGECTALTGEPGGACWTVDPDGAGPAAAFGLTDPGFTDRSLRGNAVLRWEYRPGSTLFFVWQQQRSGSDPFARFDPARAPGDLFDEPAHDVFLVKATYWIGG